MPEFVDGTCRTPTEGSRSEFLVNVEAKVNWSRLEEWRTCLEREALGSLWDACRGCHWWTTLLLMQVMDKASGPLFLQSYLQVSALKVRSDHAAS